MLVMFYVESQRKYFYCKSNVMSWRIMYCTMYTDGIVLCILTVLYYVY